MARPELPADLHELKGTKSQRKTTLDERGFVSGRPKMPKTLTPVAAEKWKELVRVLGKRGTLTKADAELLEIVCEQYARWRLYVEDLQKRGLYVTQSFVDKNGNECEREVPNQSGKFANQLENTMARNLIQLGITPASREKAKPAAPPAPKKDEIVPGSVRDLQRQQDAEDAAQLAEDHDAFARVYPFKDADGNYTTVEPGSKPPVICIGRTDAEEEEMTKRAAQGEQNAHDEQL